MRKGKGNFYSTLLVFLLFFILILYGLIAASFCGLHSFWMLSPFSAFFLLLLLLFRDILRYKKYTGVGVPRDGLSSLVSFHFKVLFCTHPFKVLLATRK